MAGRGRPRGAADIAPLVRGAFLRAAQMSEKDGRPLSMIILEQLNERPLECLKAIAQFVPKEMLVEAEVTTTHEDMTDEQLEQYAARLGKDIGISVSVARVEETTH